MHRLVFLLFLILSNVVFAGEKGGEVTLLHFGASWCPECIRMETGFFDDKSNQDVVLGRFASVRHLDADSWDDAQTFADFHVPAIPYLVAVADDGKTVDVLLGYPGRDALRQWLINVSRGEPGNIFPSGRIFWPMRRAEAALVWAMQGTPTKASQYISWSWPGSVRLAAELQIAKIRHHEETTKRLAEKILRKSIGPWTDLALSVCPDRYSIVLERSLDRLDTDQKLELISTAISGAKQAKDEQAVRRLAEEMGISILRAEVEEMTEPTGLLKLRLQQLAKYYRFVSNVDEEGLIHGELYRLYPRDADVFLNRAVFIRNNGGDLKIAENWASYGLELTRFKGDLYLRGSCTLAKILYLQSRPEEAREVLDQALRLAPLPVEGSNFTSGHWQGVIRGYMENPETMAK